MKKTHLIYRNLVFNRTWCGRRLDTPGQKIRVGGAPKDGFTLEQDYKCCKVCRKKYEEETIVEKMEE
jgi:hypothetical protein